jgi:hypothetical protein
MPLPTEQSIPAGRDSSSQSSEAVPRAQKSFFGSRWETIWNAKKENTQMSSFVDF